MTAPCSNLHYLLSLHPHYNCCHGRLSVIHIECLESDHNNYNGNPPDEIFFFFLRYIFVFSIKCKKQDSNTNTQLLSSTVRILKKSVNECERICQET